MEFEKLQGIIAEVLNLEPEEITMAATFVDDLGADSLDVFQIITGRGEYTHSSQGFPSANARMRWSANRLPHRFRALTADIPG